MRGLAWIAALAVIVGGLIWGYHYEYGTERTVSFTVKSLDDQATSGGHQYLVFATDGQVYKNTDSFWHGKEDSSNVQNDFTVGSSYTCPVFGERIFWSSSYPDILDGCAGPGFGPS